MVLLHFLYNDVIISAKASQWLTQPFVQAQLKRKHQSSASLAFWEGNSSAISKFHTQRASNAKNTFTMNLQNFLKVLLFSLASMGHRISMKWCQLLTLRIRCHAPALVTHEIIWRRAYVIQIKICAEYRDMRPRPRLVCQEPGLRPIGRSPGVPDKSSRGLGSMSRYSAQILICFIAYIFLFFVHSSVGLVGNFAGLPVCTVPSDIVHYTQNEAGHQTIKAPSMPCWGAAGPSKHSLAFKSQPGENDR